MIGEILALIGVGVIILYFLFVSYLVRRVVDRDFLYPLEVASSIDDAVQLLEKEALLPPVEEWEIASSDLLTLDAVYKPSFYPSNQCVIYVPGYRMTWSYMLLFRDCHPSNSHSLFITPRAQGESEGDFITYGTLEADDIIRWCYKVYEKLGPSTKIILHGVSLGAAACLLAAAKEDFPPFIEGVIADSCYDNAYHVIARQFQLKYHVPAWTCLPVMNWITGIWYPFSFRRANVTKVMPQIKTKVLLLHGKKDRLTPPEMANSNLAVANPNTTTLVWFENSGHGKAIFQQKEEYVNAVKSWLNQQ